MKDEIEQLARELKALRAELKRMEHKVVTCGVAATHPNAELTLREDYKQWDSPQAEAVRALRADRDRLRDEATRLKAELVARREP